MRIESSGGDLGDSFLYGDHTRREKQALGKKLPKNDATVYHFQNVVPTNVRT